MVSKVWDVMNDLEMTTAKIVSAREIIDVAAEAIQKHDYDKAETLAMAAYEFLGYYLEEFDEKFKLAWQETVKKQSEFQYTATGEKWNDFWEEMYYPEEYGLQYTDEEIAAMCDNAEKDQKKTLNYNEAVAAGWSMTDDGIWMPPQKEDKVVKWQLPIEQVHDDYFVSFPDDLLEAADLKEGDTVEWVDRGDGSYLLRKVTKPLAMDEC